MGEGFPFLKKIDYCSDQSTIYTNIGSCISETSMLYVNYTSLKIFKVKNI